MEYNTTRPKLILAEYGRNVQAMVDYAMTVSDAEERQRCAETIIRVMACRYPQQKDSQEFERMLWDHLAFISGYKLDVTSPYPISVKIEDAGERPGLSYPDGQIMFRHYGRALEQMARALPGIPEGGERQGAVELVAAQMAKSLYTWNRNVLTPEKLAEDLLLLTGGQIHYEMSQACLNAIIQTVALMPKSGNGKKKKK